MSALVARNVGKQYGESFVLQHIDLEIRRGETVGFIGPNGAGKSTFLNIVMGLLPATEGSIDLLGVPSGGRLPDGVGYVADGAQFPAHLSARKVLRQIASVRGIADAEAMRSSLERVGLDPDSHKPTRAFSHGMLQRLNLAQALMESPEFLVLDEPANGLDAEAILALRTLITELNSAGTAVLLSSHLLTEVERVCDRVLLVVGGRERKRLDLTELRGQCRVEFADTASVNVAQSHRLAISIQPSDRSAVFSTTDVPAVVADLCREGASITAVQPGSQIVEREFLKLLRGSADL